VCTAEQHQLCLLLLLLLLIRHAPHCGYML
jgi:hypothetical protein